MIRTLAFFFQPSRLGTSKTVPLDDPVDFGRSHGGWAEAIVRNDGSITIDPETLLKML